MNVPELVRYFRRVVNDRKSLVWSNADAYEYLRESYWEAFNIVYGLQERYRVDWMDLTQSQFVNIGSGVKSFELPDHVIGIVRIERPTTNGEGPRGMFPIDFVEKNKYFNTEDSFLFDSVDTKWYLFGHRLGVNDDVAFDSIRVWFVRRWPQLHSGTLGVIGTINTITFPAVPSIGGLIATDDYYKDCILEVTDATFGTVRRRISGYVASTRVATVSVNFPGIPAMGSTYSLIPEFPENHHVILPYLMGEEAMVGRGNEKQFAVIQNRRGRAQQLLSASMGIRQTQESREVKDEDDIYV